MLEKLKNKCQEVIIEKDFNSLVNTKRPLLIKAGFDPTSPDLHIGHLVLIQKLKEFQEFGHKIIFLIGDFTALIGDPSGRNETRPVLTKEQIEKNMTTYQQQIFKILDSKKTIIRFNSQWMNNLNLKSFIKLASCQTVAKMLERDDFHNRFVSQKTIHLHEFLYPLIQGYDSVVLKSDIEIGGTDQIFNLLMGRHIQKIYNQKPQIVITMPLLNGLDGKLKMSKSLGNYIGINESPKEMLKKFMTITDNLAINYYELLTNTTTNELIELKQNLNHKKKSFHQLKIELAKKVISICHGEQEALKIEEQFNYQKINYQNVSAIDFFLKFKTSYFPWSGEKRGTIATNSEIRRWFENKAITINDKIINWNDEINFPVTNFVVFHNNKKKRNTII